MKKSQKNWSQIKFCVCQSVLKSWGQLCVPVGRFSFTEIFTMFIGGRLWFSRYLDDLPFNFPDIDCWVECCYCRQTFLWRNTKLHNVDKVKFTKGSWSLEETRGSSKRQINSEHKRIHLTVDGLDWLLFKTRHIYCTHSVYCWKLRDFWKGSPEHEHWTVLNVSL